jgi:hypothetical protein
MTGAGLPHSETPGSTLGCQLPGAYRRLPRPSSAPDAKASTVCPKKLEHNKNKMLAFTMQFSKHERTPTHTPTNHHRPRTSKAHDVVWEKDRSRTRKSHPPTRRHGIHTPRRKQPPPGGRFLRTQQCARPYPQPPLMDFLDPAETGQYSHLMDQRQRSNSQCSTNERTHLQDVRLQRGSWTPHPETSGVCGQCAP